MAKVTLDPVSNLQNEQSALATINTNSARIAAAMENTLSRDGTSPNEMNADLDMNNNRIYNLPEPVGDTEPLRRQDASEILDLVDEFEEVIEASAGAIDAWNDMQALYLGTKTTLPTLDNQGNPLQEGALVTLVSQPNPANDGMYYYFSGSWHPIQDTPIGFTNRQTQFGTLDQTVFNVTGGYEIGKLWVVRNGVFQFIGTPSSVGDTTFDCQADDGLTVVFPAGVIKENDIIETFSFNQWVNGNQSASTVDIDPIAGISATTAQGALEELQTEKLAVAASSTDMAAVRFVGTSGNSIENSPLLIADTTGDLSRSGNGGIDIQGTNTNDSAPAGYIGEFMEATRASGSAISLTTATAANITSVSLTAGDWDVWGTGTLVPSAGPTTIFLGVSPTSAGLEVPPVGGVLSLSVPFASGSSQTVGVSPRRFSLSATTTIYLVTRVVFASGTCTAYGGIYARRVR